MTSDGDTRIGRAPLQRRTDWPLWEVFVRARRGLSHQHVGSLHAPDAAMALRNARDVYTRRGEGRLDLGGPVRGDHRVQPRREGPVLRPGRWTRPTGTRRSTTFPKECPAPVSRASEPDDVDPTLAAALRLRSRLGDDALILAQRLGEWIDPRAADRGGHRAGQHRARPARARPARCSATPARSKGAGRDEDDLAYLRDEREFRNVHLVELDNGDFAVTMARQLLFSAYQLRALRAAAARRTDADARRARRQGRQGGRLPPRPRHPVGAPARRRHRRVPRRMQAGLDGLAVRRGALRHRRHRAVAGRRRHRGRPVDAAPGWDDVRRGGARRGHADRARPTLALPAAAGSGIHTEGSVTCWPRCSTCTVHTPERPW